jgi:CRISPR-associated protein Cpf1
VIEKKQKELYEQLFQIINVILTIRNSETERETLEHKKIDKNYIAKDFIHCPVCKYHSEKKLNISERGKSRNIEKLENADANGAYNIARKGGIVLGKIKD